MDQIEILIPETIVNEGSAFTAAARFRDRATAAASAPTNAKYRVDCLSTGDELQALTSASAAASVSIAITPAHNAIRNPGNSYEVKQLTVIADHDLPTQQVEVVFWRVENLFGSP